MELLLKFDREVFDHAGFIVRIYKESVAVVRSRPPERHRHHDIPDRSVVHVDKSAHLSNLRSRSYRSPIIEYNVLYHAGALERSDHRSVVAALREGKGMTLKVNRSGKVRYIAGIRPLDIRDDRELSVRICIQLRPELRPVRDRIHSGLRREVHF